MAEAFPTIDLTKKTPKRPSWYWQNRIVANAYNVVQGDMGVGKGLLFASIAAIGTTNMPHPDAPHVPTIPGHVVYLGVEDNIEDTILPRFLAAGGDKKRLHPLKITVESCNLALDLDRIAETFKGLGDGPLLLLVDPFNSFVAGVNTHKDAEVRSFVTNALAIFAQGSAVTVIVLNHLTKDVDQSDLYRGHGSTAITAAARAVWKLEIDPEDRDRRLMLPVKMNLARMRDGMAFRIGVVEVKGAGLVPRAEWEQEPIAIPDSPAGRMSERQRASRFVWDTLADGPMEAAELRKRAETAGFAWRTINRAKRDLEGVEVKPVRDGDGRVSQWIWSRRGRSGPECQSPNTPFGIVDLEGQKTRLPECQHGGLGGCLGNGQITLLDAPPWPLNPRLARLLPYHLGGVPA